MVNSKKLDELLKETYKSFQDNSYEFDLRNRCQSIINGLLDDISDLYDKYTKGLLLDNSLKEDIIKRAQKSNVSIEEFSQFKYKVQPKSLIDITRHILKDYPEGISFKSFSAQYEDWICSARVTANHPERGEKLHMKHFFRMVSVALDPKIEELKFSKTRKALECALNGESYDGKRWDLSDFHPDFIIPHNLPDTEHESTRLIGRQNDIEQLIDRLKSRKSFNIVGVGGGGKTALAIETLMKFNNFIESGYSCIIYTTAKQKELTINGIETIDDSIISVRDLKDIIIKNSNEILNKSYKNINDLINDEEAKNFLICIDNAETFIEKEQENFSDLLDDLPCTFITTSRNFVDGIKSYQLKSLKVEDCEKLTRIYCSNKNLDIDNIAIKSILNNTFNNPLAIKIACNLLDDGVELKKALETSSKNIAIFAFQAQIDNLSELSKTMLILLSTFKLLNSTQFMTHLSNIEATLIFDELRSLKKLGIIISENSDDSDLEIYKITPVFLELYISSGLRNKNTIAIDKIKEDNKKAKGNKQKILNAQTYRHINEWSWAYFRLEYNENFATIVLKILHTSDFYHALNRANIFSNKTKENISLAQTYIKELKNNEKLYEEYALYHSLLARLYTLISVIDEAELHYKYSISKRGNKSLYTYYGRFIMEVKQDFQAAVIFYKDLVDDIKGNMPDHVVNVAIKSYFLAHIFQNNGVSDKEFSFAILNKVIEETNNWRKEKKEYRITYGLMRMTARERLLEFTDFFESENYIDNLLNLVETAREMKYAYIKDDNSKEWKKIVTAIVDEALYRFKSNSYYSGMLDNNKLDLLNFIDEFLLDSTKNDIKSVVLLLREINIDNNPFYNEKWAIYVDSEDLNSVINIVGVKPHIKNNKIMYFVDTQGKQYYCHLDNFFDSADTKFLNNMYKEAIHYINKNNTNMYRSKQFSILIDQNEEIDDDNYSKVKKIILPN